MKIRNFMQLVATMGAVSVACNVLAQQAVPLAAEANGVPLTVLQKVVDQAITTHPEINARYHDFISSLEDQKISRAGWRPQVTAQAWTGHEWRDRNDFNGTTDWTRPGWSLELRQLIFDGGAVSNRIHQFGYEKLSRFYDLQATSNGVASETVGAYLDVQRYRSMQALAKENYDMHETTYHQLRERQDSGVGRGVDMEQANGRLSLAQTNLMTESNNLNEVTQRYRRLVGEYPPEQMPAVPDVMDGLPVIGYTKNFEQALRVNPSILSKQALVQAAQAGTKVAQAAYAPTVDVRVTTGRDREQPSAGGRNVQSTSALLMLTYPLYRGGADAARIRQTAAQSYAAQDVRDYTCRNVQQELSVTWNNIVRMRQQLPFLRDHELSTAKVRVAYTQQYRIGQRSLLDLLDTENELFDARRALINAEFDLKKAEYYWLSVSNQVISNLGLVHPYQDDRPAEEQTLALPDDPLNACMEALPNTSNLLPVAMKQSAAPAAPVPAGARN